MKKFIIITSIFEPTEAVRKFAQMKDYSLVVVGDKKSPKTYDCANVTFLSADKNYGFELEKVLPYNHYSRKMLGYLYAMQNNADVIIDTDDDNIPYDNWNFPQWNGDFKHLDSATGFANIYNYYTDQKIWPRGLPLDCINNSQPELLEAKPFKIGVWQGLADIDPDVDAIYRLVDNTPCYFDKNQGPIVLNKGTICPFNTQNTAFTKDLFVLEYLPTTVTFRFTDILKGLIAQPLMWHYGYNLGFTTATVKQERNEHDYMKDFVSEIPCYTEARKTVEITKQAIIKDASIYQNLQNVYTALFEANIVQKEELKVLDAWITDCKNLLS